MQPASTASSPSADHAHGTPPLHVIAEAGTNHGGRLDTARRLVGIAREAGAQSVKFQIIYPEGLYLPEFLDAPGEARGAASYRANEVFAKRAAMMLRDEDYAALAREARELGLPMSASVFDERGVKLLDRLDAPYIKFASCDLNNPRLLRAGAATGRRVIISTGMSTLGEIERAVCDLTSQGPIDLVIMHCVSVYPARFEQMNLGFIGTLRAAFGFPVGLSDHTEDSRAAVAAAAMGVRWFEKHFTYDRSAEGFDHAYAMEPAGLAAYIGDVRACVAATTPRRDKLADAERSVKVRARRSIYAARDIAPGETLTEADLLVVRPEGPLAPGDLPGLVGKTASRGLRRFEPLTWGVVA